MFVKICGIRNLPALLAATEAGADAVGFVFHAPSPRYVTPAEAIPLAAIAGRARVKVGVFVDEPALEIAGIADAARLDHVQIHPGRDLAAVKKVCAALGMAARPIGIILGVAVPYLAPRSGEGTREAADDARAAALDEATAFIRSADPEMAIVEGASPTGDGGVLPGGNGRAWDWSLLRELDERLDGKVPLLLAGGLTVENVREASRLARPHGVDVSSGVESDGRKDPDKIRAFVGVAKEADAFDRTT